MKTTTLFITVLLLFAVSGAFSQNHLRSGNIDLSNSLIGPSVNPSIFEGGGTIDDASGNLLYQTNGYHLYDGAGVQIGNNNSVGYSLCTTAAQAGLILLKPGTNNQYYVFTIEGHPGSGHGLSYSIWAYSGNVTTLVLQRTPLNKKCIEQLTSYCDTSGGYWIVSHESGKDGHSSKKYVAYHLTAGALNTTPVTSTGVMSYPTPVPGNNRFGTIVISPDGKRICSAFGGYPIASNTTTVELGYFDNATGIISGMAMLQKSTSGNPLLVSPAAYKSAFSPNSKVLYLSSVWVYNGSPIPVRQFDLIAANARIDASTSTTDVPEAVSLAPDGVIYGVNFSNNTQVASIPSPNTVGTGCGYNSNTFPTNTIQGSYIFSQTPPNCDINPCGNDTIITDLGDIELCNGGSYTVCNQSYNTPGTYNVVCTDSDGCQHTYHFFLYNSTLVAHAGPDIYVAACCNATFNGSATGGIPPYTYAWSPTTGLSNPNIANPTCQLLGTYTLTVTDSKGCTSTDQAVAAQGQICCRVGEEDNSISKANVFPNPSLDNFTLRVTGDAVARLMIYNMIGQLVETEDGKPGDIQFGSKLATGTYTLQVIYANGKSEKLQVQKILIK